MPDPFRTDRPRPPVVQTATWRRLLTAATKLAAEAPWEWLYDCDLLGLPAPPGEEGRLASVMGNSGELFGAMIFRGALGGGWLLNQTSGRVAGYERDQAEHGQDCLKVEFVLKSELEAEDLAMYRLAGYTPVSKGKRARWPVFRSFKPGYVPWPLDQAEAELLIADLDRVFRFLVILNGDRSYFRGRFPDEVPFLLDREDAPAAPGPAPLQWKRVPVPEPPELVPVPIDETLALRLCTLPQPRDLVWEVDAGIMDIMLVTPNRPAFAQAGMVVQAQVGRVLHAELGTPPARLEQTAVKALLTAMEKAGVRPGLLHVQHGRLRVGLQEIARECGMDLRLVASLPASDVVRASLFDRWPGGQ